MLRFFDAFLSGGSAGDGEAGEDDSALTGPSSPFHHTLQYHLMTSKPSLQSSYRSGRSPPHSAIVQILQTPFDGMAPAVGTVGCKGVRGFKVSILQTLAVLQWLRRALDPSGTLVSC